MASNNQRATVRESVPATFSGHSSPEANQIDAMARMSPETSMMRMENDQSIAVAMAHPRDLAKVRDELEHVMKEFPAVCEQLIYAKPVGKDDEGNQKIARGLSVRAAEMIAEAYGNCRIASTTTPLDNDHASIRAVFTDLQKMKIWEVTVVTSKLYKTRSGSTGRMPDDRFYGTHCPAIGSKLLREAIMRSVNPALKAWFWQQAEMRIGKAMTEAGVEKVITAFSGIGVVMSHLERLLGAKKNEWTIEHRKTLAEVWTAIDSGQATVSEVFDIRLNPMHDESKDVVKDVVSDSFISGSGQAAGGPESAGAGPVTADNLRRPSAASTAVVNATAAVQSAGAEQQKQEPEQEQELESASTGRSIDVHNDTQGLPETVEEVIILPSGTVLTGDDAAKAQVETPKVETKPAAAVKPVAERVTPEDWAAEFAEDLRLGHVMARQFRLRATAELKANPAVLKAMDAASKIRQEQLKKPQ